MELLKFRCPGPGTSRLGLTPSLTTNCRIFAQGRGRKGDPGCAAEPLSWGEGVAVSPITLCSRLGPHMVHVPPTLRRAGAVSHSFTCSLCKCSLSLRYTVRKAPQGMPPQLQPRSLRSRSLQSKRHWLHCAVTLTQSWHNTGRAGLEI